MFEDMTYDVILKRMLDRVKNSIDKREGSIIYDALAPAAVELSIMYDELDTFLNEAFADTATREYLIRRAAERGLVPYPASCAVLKAEFIPNNVDVIGKRFNCEEFNYVVTGKNEDGTYTIQCETSGKEGEKTAGTLIPIDYINGLQTGNIVGVVIPGSDEEDTEDFRQRYINSLQSQAFGGNIADYKQKVMGIDGVGGVKVYKAAEWNGAGTVKLVIQDSDFGKPSDELIEKLQTDIDPIPNQGEGIGIAPIGHQVTVTAVNEVAVNVTATMIDENGKDISNEVKSQAKAMIADYFKELNKSWAGKEKGITVLFMQIGARLQNIERVQTVNVQLNNMENYNIILEKDEIIAVNESIFNGSKLGE